jgi:integrase
MTVSNDLTWVGVVLRAAKSVKGLPVHPEPVEEARNACRELRLIGKSRRRERRPTATELTKLDEYFARRDGRSRVPMRDIMWFAIHSARREAEICRLEWADNAQRGRTGLVRDAKHPRHKEGNHRRFKFTAEAWEIIERQPKTGEYIFPWDPKSVSAAFTRACHVLGIMDLRFHDLRHEATGRLFERGYQIHEVTQFTLHESWNELKRYTNLRPENVREMLSALRHRGTRNRLML